MIQINLLPDVKMQYVKAKKLRRTIIAICFIVSAISVGLVMIIAISVYGVQSRHMANLEQDIADKTKELQQVPDVARILTVQNQLLSLPALQSNKPEASRTFTYIKQIAPTEASIDSLTVDFEKSTMEISGNAVDLAAVNKFADILKFTKYVPSDSSDPSKGQSAFSVVTLDKFGISSTVVKSGKPASYTLKLSYAPDIMSSIKDVKLTIPNQVTTRSELDALSNLFKQAPTSQGGAR